MPKKRKGKKKNKSKSASSPPANALSLVHKIEALVDDKSKFSSPKAIHQCVEAIHRQLGILQAQQEPLEAVKQPDGTTEKEKTAICTEFAQWCLASMPPPMQEKIGTTLEVRPSEDGNEGNGIFALRSIKPQEIIMHVPRSLFITATQAMACPLTALLAKDYPPLLQTPVICLALQLCAEAMLGNNSKYYPYVKILPSTFTIPLFYSPQDVKDLIGTSIFFEHFRHYCTVVKHYCLFYRLLAKNELANKESITKKFTWALFSWAVAVVMTRQNQVPAKQEEPATEEAPEDPASKVRMELALCPLFDMVNHENSEKAEILSDFTDNDTLVLYAKRAFSRGEQVRMFYGQRTSGKYLQYSGFVPDEVARDRVPVTIHLRRFFNMQEPLTKITELLLGQAGFGLRPGKNLRLQAQCFISRSGDIDKNLIGLCRLRVASKADIENFIKTVGKLTQLDKFVTLSDEKEVACVRLLQRIMKQTMSFYPADLAATEKLLKRPGSFHKLSALKLRRIELMAFTAALKYLNLAEKAIMQQLEAASQKNGNSSDTNKSGDPEAADGDNDGTSESTR